MYNTQRVKPEELSTYAALGVVEPWVARLTATAAAEPPLSADPYLRRGNPESFLRALHLQLLLSGDSPEIRSDLLLVLGDALRARTRRTSRRTGE